MAIFSIFSTTGEFQSYNGLNTVALFSTISTTALARSIVPSPPFSQPSDKTAFTPILLHASLINWISSSESLINALMATTGSRLNFRIFSICFSKLGNPFFTYDKFGVPY